MKRKLAILLPVFIILISGGLISQNTIHTPKKVEKAKYFDQTPQLRNMKVILPGERDRSWKDGIIKNESLELNNDMELNSEPVNPEATQNYFGTMGTRGPEFNFDGIGNVNGVYPPDTDGDVGPNHYFQMINLSFAIWNKSGELLYGPVDNSTLWQGFIGPWTGSNDGDPIVIYDEVADRWVATQFAVNQPNGKSYELVAVSQTSDPLGAYYRYAFEFDDMNDYPKLGVWNDGYYTTYHMFSGGFQGAAIAVFERDKMLIGDPDAAMVYFGEYPSIFGLLPADFDGPAPPLGAPNYIMDMDDSHNIDIYKVTIDWDNPNSSTFALDVSLTPDAYSSNLNGIPQPGTSSKLDALANMLMFRLQYRNFGTYETMVTNHTVSYYGRAAVRWYELRRENDVWSIYQQGTYSPDGTSRWMGSVAMNGNGEIALGFSASSSSVYPSVRYTGRSADAPLGEMNYDEIEVVAGLSSQTNISRWGDYACMSVDPASDTTFWFTQEYRKSSGWGTWITSFDFTPPVAPVISTGGDDTICEYQYFTPQATAMYTKSVEWETTGDGIFVNSNILKTTYAHGGDDLENGEVTLILTAYGFGEGLVSVDSMVLYVNKDAYAFAGNDTIITIDANLATSADASSFSNVLWETSGDGMFEDGTLVNTIYTPGTNDIADGEVNLTLTAYPLPPCEDEDTDMMVLTIDGYTSINENEKDFDILVVPNPSNGIFTFNITNKESKSVKITITDLQGQLVFTQIVETLDGTNQKQIDMSNYAKGTYLFRAETGNNIRYEKIILK